MKIWALWTFISVLFFNWQIFTTRIRLLIKCSGVDFSGEVAHGISISTKLWKKAIKYFKNYINSNNSKRLWQPNDCWMGFAEDLTIFISNEQDSTIYLLCRFQAKFCINLLKIGQQNWISLYNKFSRHIPKIYRGFHLSYSNIAPIQ